MACNADFILCDSTGAVLVNSSKDPVCSPHNISVHELEAFSDNCEYVYSDLGGAFDAIYHVIGKSFKANGPEYYVLAFSSKAAQDDFYERIFDGADASAKLLGYTITVTNINLEGLPQLLKDAELQNTDGIIFFASEFEPVHAEMLTETSLPLVVVDSRLLEQPINSVTVESMCSVYQALKYLYDLGHRRIGFLTADEATGALPERQNAFYLCQKRLGLEAGVRRILLRYRFLWSLRVRFFSDIWIARMIFQPHFLRTMTSLQQVH